jgi:acetyltransferase-like isoleucine patch superfamily enzyme
LCLHFYNRKSARLILNKILFAIIKNLPSNFLRVFCYKKIFKYQIGNNVKIGKKVIINCKKVTLQDNVFISYNNSISCNELFIGKNASILRGNVIVGKSDFKMGSNSTIIYDHYFDVWNSITIGNNTWIAGKGSQVWTHGSIHTKRGIKDLGVYIGDNNYVGSGVLFAPGSRIGNNNLIGLGSVVTKAFASENTIISGNPATVIRENIDWRENW